MPTATVDGKAEYGYWCCVGSFGRILSDGEDPRRRFLRWGETGRSIQAERSDRSRKFSENRETHVIAPGVFEMSFLMLMFGGMFGGGVLGLPPGERDAAFVQCPPKDVILYTEWASRGKGKPGAAGIDGFAADPEVLAFIAAIDKAIHDTIDAMPGDQKVLGQNIPPLVKLLLNRPGCVYVDVDAKSAVKLMAEPPKLPPFIPPQFGMLPAAQATVIFNGGDDADAIAKHLQALCKLLPESQRAENLKHQKFPTPLEGASMELHRHKNYFILGWGKDTVDAAIKGLSGESQGLKDNPRFESAMEKVTLERTASVTWIDMKSLVKKAVEGLGPQGLVVAAVMQQLGAESIESLAVCTGIVDGQMHSRAFLYTGGKTEGILALAAGRPLKASDFAQVPEDADLALGFSLDAAKVLETAQRIVGQADPQSKQVFDQIIAELEKELGLSFNDDIFQAFGNAWVLYDSPSNGGILATAPVLGWEVTDHAKAQVAFEKFMEVLKRALPPMSEGRFPRGVKLTKKTFLDHDIYFINSVGRVDAPFAPAFTLTKNQLLVALFPQTLKSHLRFLNSKQGRFEAKFDEKIKNGGGELFAVSYSRPELFSRYVVTVLPMMGTAMFAEMQREVQGLDLFEMPSARAILPYVGEGLITKERTEDGILVNYRHGIPIPGVSSMMLTMPVFGWASFRVRRMEAPRAVPAIQINQHVPQSPPKEIRRGKIPRATAS